MVARYFNGNKKKWKILKKFKSYRKALAYKRVNGGEIFRLGSISEYGIGVRINS